MYLETKRLILREPKVADAQAYCHIHNSLFVLRYNAMQPTTPERMEGRFQDREYLENTVFLEEVIEEPREKSSGSVVFEEFDEDDFDREVECHVDGDMPYDYVTYTRKHK